MSSIQNACRRSAPIGAITAPEVDALLEKQRVEMDRDKRKALLSQVQKIVAEDEPYINLWYVDNIAVHRARVTDVTIAPSGDFDFLAAVNLR